MLSSQKVALLGVLAALNAMIRLMGAGVAGIETAFALIVLAGYVFGSSFGFSLGVLSILASAIIGGGIGPWLPFQLIGAALVGAGAGLLPKRKQLPAKLFVLSFYSVLASYFYGIFLTAWTWPLFVGPGTSISYLEGAPLWENVSRFVQFEIVSGGLLWDTGRAITTVTLIVLTGKVLLQTLERVTTRPDFSKTL
jgi:energy-coupling factor transport system substrate-specific component